MPPNSIIYVDAPIFKMPGRRGRWCHLFSYDVDALHEFAQILGMKREWFQNDRWPHYDMVTWRRELAVQYGAVVAGRKTLIAIARYHMSR